MSSVEDGRPNIGVPIRREVSLDGSMSDSPHATDVAREISAAVRKVRHATVKLVDGEVQETGMERHHFPMVMRSSVGVLDPTSDEKSEQPNKKTTIIIPELIAHHIYVTMSRLNVMEWRSSYLWL